MKDKQELLRKPSNVKKSYLPDEKLKHSPANYSFRMYNIWSVHFNIRVEILKQTDIHLPLLHAKNSLVFRYSPVNHLWVIPCSLIQGCQRFGGVCFFQLQFTFLSTETGQEVPLKKCCLSTFRQSFDCYIHRRGKLRLSYPVWGENGSSAPYILNLKARSRRVIVFTLRTFYLLEMSPN